MRTFFLFLFALVLPASIPAQPKWTLAQCISHALEHNLTVREKEAEREQSKIDVSTAKGNFLPSLNGSASHSFNFGRSLQADNTYKSLNTQSTGLNLTTSIPLFTGLQTVNNVALSKLNLLAATEDLNKAKEDISIQIAQAYLQVLLDGELSQVARSQVATSKELLAQKEAYYRAGKASESEWREAQARVAQDELSAVQAENSRTLSLLDLSQLLELSTPEGFDIVPPDTGLVEKSAPLPSPADVYAEAVLSKPDIKAAQYRLEGAQKDIRIAQGAYYPQLSFGAGLSTNFYNVSGRENGNFGSQLRDNFSQYVGLSLNIPIFNRLSTRNKVRSARIRQATLNWQLEESKKTLYKEIQQAYYNAVTAQAQYASSRTADEAAEAAFRLAKEKYLYGKANATEYNEARTNWMKAVSDRIQAKYDFLFRTKILDFYRGVPLTLE